MPFIQKCNKSKIMNLCSRGIQHIQQIDL